MVAVFEGGWINWQKAAISRNIFGGEKKTKQAWNFDALENREKKDVVWKMWKKKKRVVKERRKAGKEEEKENKAGWKERSRK